MPEMGRPVTNQEMRYRQVEMAPKALNSKGQTEREQREALINKATGYMIQIQMISDLKLTQK